MKKLTVLVLVTALFLGVLPGAAYGAFSDVPRGHWAEGYIEEAEKLGIMQGIGQGRFGLGQNVKRGEFVAMLVRLFGWEKISPETGSFTDNQDKTKWYFADIETAVSMGAVKTDQSVFRPEDKITREEMAMMLVRALGYEALAAGAEENGLLSGFPFTDVTKNLGHIALASDFGIITGKTQTAFNPSGYALREEAAAMMIRLHARYRSKPGWRNAYYAISSYAQRDKLAGFNSVTFGWSRLHYHENNGVTLMTTSVSGNEFAVPDGYEIPVNLAREKGLSTSLNVFLSAEERVVLPNGNVSDACSAILLNEEYRDKAIELILEELTRVYPNTETSLYDGVTLDFECMRGETLKAAYTDFLTRLKPLLDERGKSLAVAVHPVWRKGLAYYDGYDYRALGELADRVILMAHDYAAKTMDEDMMNAGFTTTPVTPFPDVYYALKSITDPATGVRDKEKIALAISIDSVGWNLMEGYVFNSTPTRFDPPTLYQWLEKEDTEIKYSETYRNPYAAFSSTRTIVSNDIHNGTKVVTDYVVWYEDARSVRDKIDLAKMFGVTGISVWRLGLIPDYASPEGRELHYDIYSELIR